MLIPGLNRATDRQRLQLGPPYWLLNDDTHTRACARTHIKHSHVCSHVINMPLHPHCVRVMERAKLLMHLDLIGTPVRVGACVCVCVSQHDSAYGLITIT